MPSLKNLIGTCWSFTRRAKHPRHLLSQFANLWRKEYLLSLREHHLQSKGKPSSELGDVGVVE